MSLPLVEQIAISPTRIITDFGCLRSLTYALLASAGEILAKVLSYVERTAGQAQVADVTTELIQP